MIKTYNIDGEIIKVDVVATIYTHENWGVRKIEIQNYGDYFTLADYSGDYSVSGTFADVIDELKGLLAETL